MTASATGTAPAARWLAAGVLALPLLAGSPAAPAATSGRPAYETVAGLAPAVPDSIPLQGRVVYVDFWASWCVPCRSSFPWMERLRDRLHGRGLQVITVNLDKDASAARRFLADTESSLPVIRDPDGRLARAWRLQVMPTSFVYGRDGRLAARHEGFHPADADSVESLIRRLLDEESPR